MPPMDLPIAAAAIVAAGRRLGARGLISAGEGNLSIRLDDERVAITPSGRRKDELGVDDVVAVHMGRDLRDARSATGLAPSSDLAIHLAALAARPDIGAVAHAHLPASMALTLAGEVPDPAVLPEAALFIPRLPFLAYGMPGSEELAARISAALVELPEPFADVVLLERHGAVAVGPDLPTAVDRLELVEVLCAAWRDSLLVRAARVAIDPGHSRLD
jgi:L-fuculose-phosphate aldolase